MQESTARPFLKWAGGKTQLLSNLDELFPPELKQGRITHYFEPFIGGGAVFFYLAQKYGIKNNYISDINKSLINLYNVIKNNPRELISQLASLSKLYNKNIERQSRFFYEKRKEFNDLTLQTGNKTRYLLRASALMIFLNRTCFNGLFRMNSRGEFNAPHGDYINPGIVNEKNIMLASAALKDTTIECCDYHAAVKRIKALKNPSKAFVYFDPPYRPLTLTSRFTSYSGSAFNDDEQKKLSEVFRKLSGYGVKILLSNSDPKNSNPDDDFFDKLYAGFNIMRVPAKRKINSKSNLRGNLNELVITNY